MDFDQMKFRCPGAEYLGVATLPNYELKMDAAGFATVIPAPGKHVQGALWDLSNANENKMDGFEGVSSHCYEKSYVEVQYAGNHTKAPSSRVRSASANSNPLLRMPTRWKLSSIFLYVDPSTIGRSAKIT